MTLQVAADPFPFPALGGLSAEDCAVLVIDMQADFCSDDGYLAALGYDPAPLRRPIAPIARVLAAARAAGLHVLHSRQGYRRDLADATPYKLWRARRNGVEIGSEGPLGRILLRGEPGWQIIPELAPLDGEPVIDKTANSAFIGTDLDQVLRARGIANLVVCGNTIDVCVHCTLREANDRGYCCLLLADACGAVDAALHAAAVAMVKVEGGVFGTVADSAAFVAALERLSRGSR